MRFGFSSALKFAFVASSVWMMTGCSEAADTGVPVALPSVRFQCQTPQCLTNATGPLINAAISRGSCSDAVFTQVAGYATLSTNCTSSGGCTVQIPTNGWVDASGTVLTTIPSGTYSVCGCIDFDRSSDPFVNCDQEGTKESVLIDANTGLVSVTTWN